MRRATPIKHYFLKDINAVIRFLIASDVVANAAVGLLGPVFALFIEDFIVGGNAAVAGLAAGIYLFTRSVFQIPVAHFIDRIRGERDDFWMLFIFMLLSSLIPLLYLVIDTPLELYIIQATLGLLTAFTYPTWMTIFTRHIDKHKEGTEWAVYFTLADISAAAFSALGGFIAFTMGFQALIVGVSIISVLGALFIYPIKPYLRTKT